MIGGRSEGYYNTFLGHLAGRLNTIGPCNTFIGNDTGYSNTTGGNSTLVGYQAGYMSTEGSYNTYLGFAAGYSNTTGLGNVFLGYRAGYYETGSTKLYIDNSDTGNPLIYGEFDNDVVAINGKLGVGTQSPGYNLEIKTTGENAVFLLDRMDGVKAGYAAYSDKALLGTVTNHPLMFAVNYGWRMRLNSDNSLVMANGAQCTAGGVWEDASSRKFKENIQDLTLSEATEALSGLNPVKFNYKNDNEDKHLGFIAEDVPALVASKDRKSMSPMDVVAVLTKVIQTQLTTMRAQQVSLKQLQVTLIEQQKSLDDFKKTIFELQNRIAEIEKKFE
jgi:hypothetical protein